jgi:DNA polymerase-1
MIMQVHDELVFDTLKSELEQVQTIVRHEMTHAADLKVPLVVDMNHGANWLEAH